MTDTTITSDLSEFGFRELKMAAELLTALTRGGGWPEDLGTDVKVWMNKNSGYVFLCDEDYNIAMMNGDVLEMFLSCPNCRNEGFADEIDWNTDHNLCGECAEADEE